MGFDVDVELIRPGIRQQTPPHGLQIDPLTGIQHQDELEADVVGDVEADLLQPGGEVVKLRQELGHAEQAEGEQVELLAVREHGAVGQAVVKPLVDVIEDEHHRPRGL